MSTEVNGNEAPGSALDNLGLCRRCIYRRTGLLLANAWRAGAVLLLTGLPIYWAWLQASDHSWHLDSAWVTIYSILALGSIALAFGVRPLLKNGNGG